MMLGSGILRLVCLLALSLWRGRGSNDSVTEKQLSEFMLRHPSEERYAINWLPAKIINRVMEMHKNN